MFFIFKVYKNDWIKYFLKQESCEIYLLLRGYKVELIRVEELDIRYSLAIENEIDDLFS